MPKVYRYVKNKTDYRIYVNIKDTQEATLLDDSLLPNEIIKFDFYLSDNIHDFNHMKKLYIKLDTGNDIYTSLYSTHKAGVGLDYFFNVEVHKSILIYFEMRFSSFSLAASSS
ncbi:hypothetical protein [Xenorhabdus szentirmaii]|uniref:Uncharacterized protein n=2 Tax=Xenorhabdus szentirmaii TaxID=290112 RepID=W1IYL8_9GAMM|nr:MULTISPECIES: hypothetical protein [Xenorhabdus]MBD2780475.1 hypothetical protein [Xenorhabdus sp. 38]MBD2791224.1 hypothetical protein [Xenorhabdus sp. CUL]MBD2799347.1 hypothetical protein [Xenorhabdus sp. M]MBD2805399.1 hypothetical protein [Xenorhabdus sp. ZM]MBD2819403.1 hypothetical protein [Xenorhabdus sp. 42]